MKSKILVMAIAVILAGCGEVQTHTEEAKQGQTKQQSQSKQQQKSQAKQSTKTQKMQQANINQEYAQKYSGAILKTNLGDIEVEFYNQDSPMTVSNFLQLADEKFYEGTKFHRVISDFMIQGGDPNSKSDDPSTYGMGGPDYKFPDEFNDHKLVRGSLAMANSGPNTNGSQFFIVTADATPHLDGRHTNFGKVTKGMEVVDKIEASDTNSRDLPLEDVVIEGVELISNE